MLDRMPPGLFTEWMAYDQLEPLGMERLRQMIAEALSMYFNVRFNSETTPETFSGDAPRGSSAVQSDAEQIAIARQIAAMHNGSL